MTTFTAGLSLVSDLIPLYIQRYEWTESAHPRQNAGTTVGGQFRPAGGIAGTSSTAPSTGGLRSGVRSTKKREIAALPDTVKPGHGLHTSALKPETAQKLNEWHGVMKSIMQGVEQAKSPEEEESQWAKVNKDHVRMLFNSMNQMDRDHKSQTGQNLSDYVNANGMIPKSLAERLDSGRRFFDPEAIRNKLKASPEAKPPEVATPQKPDSNAPYVTPRPKLSPEEAQVMREYGNAFRPQRKAMLEDPRIRAVVEKAMGLTPADPSARPSPAPENAVQQSPELAQDQPSVQANEPPAKKVDRRRVKETGLTVQENNRMESAIMDFLGDDSHEHRVALGSMVPVALRRMNSSAEEWNDAIRNLHGHFSKKGLGGMVANIGKAGDATHRRAFDEMVDIAQTDYPFLLTHRDGPEAGLMEAFHNGLKPTYKVDSPEVIEEAANMLGPSFRQSLEELWSNQNESQQPAYADAQDDPLPFSVRAMMQWMRRTERIPA
jgi:hypothetical protein